MNNSFYIRIEWHFDLSYTLWELIDSASADWLAT